MASPPPRRLAALAVHVTAAPTLAAPSPLPNNRPGDSDVKPVKDSYFVSGHFEPRADEISETLSLGACCLDGRVPVGLRGTFLRIGPNPRFDFRGKPYHVFDGDGMIHKVDFAGDGEGATYQNRWVRTMAFEKEAKNGFSFSIMGEAAEVARTGNLAWLPHARSTDDIGRANTALVWHEPRGKLLALFEQDKPYEVDIGTLETTRRVDEFPFPTFTAHPKVCSVTGDMVYFGYINGPKEGPWLHYGVVDARGKLVRSFPVTIPAPVMMHDIAVTTNYSLFYDYNNKYNNPKKVMKGEAKAMYEQDVSLPARFGVLPRMATSEHDIQWIECKLPSVVFHFANAWEEADGEHIRVYGCAMDSVDLDDLAGTESRPSGGRMHLWRLNIKTGVCEEDRDFAQVATMSCDFPQVAMDRVGQKCRYAYAAHFIAGFTVDGVIKFDLENETWTRHRYDSGKHDSGAPDGGVYGGESMFARRGDSGEDDGWLLSFTYGDARCASSLDIVDARTMERVSRVAMPTRVPAGFHALWKPASV